MERRGVPIRIIAPGKVFRRDTPDMTHRTDVPPDRRSLRR
ncbi:MAG: hypothetical protein R2682_11540 [Pyrinomonadaceae bacterium]